MTILYLSTRFKEKVSFITYYGPLNAIKSKWQVPAWQRPRAPRTQNWFDDAENLYTAALHKIIVENRFQLPINETNITRLGAACLGVHKIYNWSFKITKGTKLVMFNFKINRCIIYTKVKLKEANLISDDMCHLCKTEKHATKHIFLQCFHVVSFLNDLRAWWHFNTKENTFEFMDMPSPKSTWKL